MDISLKVLDYCLFKVKRSSGRPEFLYHRHMNVVRLSALRTGYLYPRDSPGTHFCQRLSGTQGHSVAGRIKPMETPMNPSVNEPAKFQHVAQSVNQLRHNLPYSYYVLEIKFFVVCGAELSCPYCQDHSIRIHIKDR